MRKKVRFFLSICLMFGLLLNSSASAADVNSTYSYSQCVLINPPNSSVYWGFGGNQIIWVTLKNANVLGVTAVLTCEIFAGNRTRYFMLLPYAKTKEIRYDILAPVPVGWRFTLSTISSAAFIIASAH